MNFVIKNRPITLFLNSNTNYNVFKYIYCDIRKMLRQKLVQNPIDLFPTF
jgi:hypothetical protein